MTFDELPNVEKARIERFQACTDCVRDALRSTREAVALAANLECSSEYLKQAAETISQLELMVKGLKSFEPTNTYLYKAKLKGMPEYPSISDFTLGEK